MFGCVNDWYVTRSTALMMDAARTSETSVDIQVRTRHYIPEDSELHTRRRENLKSHIDIIMICSFCLKQVSQI
jgi:hypothetical protein